MALPLIPLIAGGVGLASAIGKAIPSKQDRFNRQRLKGLLERQQQGELGLTGEERQFLTHQQMDPARRMAGQVRERQAAELHSLPGGQSASLGDVARIREAEQRGIGEAASGAASRVEAAHLAQRGQQEQEIEDRLAAGAARRDEVIGGVTGFASDALGMAQQEQFLGQLGLGAFGGPKTDWNAFTTQLTGSGFSMDDATYLQGLAQSDPQNFMQIITDSATGGPLSDTRIQGMANRYGSGAVLGAGQGV